MTNEKEQQYSLKMTELNLFATDQKSKGIFVGCFEEDFGR